MHHASVDGSRPIISLCGMVTVPGIEPEMGKVMVRVSASSHLRPPLETVPEQESMLQDPGLRPQQIQLMEEPLQPERSTSTTCK